MLQTPQLIQKYHFTIHSKLHSVCKLSDIILLYIYIYIYIYILEFDLYDFIFGWRLHVPNYFCNMFIEKGLTPDKEEH